jgi:hypothetical protein
MNSKKAITLLVLVTMLLALLPAVPVKAIAAGTLSATTGVYDDTITCTGSGVTAGADVSVYWDNALKETFTDGSGRLNTTDADPDGTFSINLDVPEALNGDHYVWVKDMSSGDAVRYATPFTVNAKLKISPSSGLPGDTMTLKGYGYGDEVDVDAVNITDDIPTTVTYSNTETNDLGSWTSTFKIPTGTAYHDMYNITAMDDEGNTATDDFKVGASITLSEDEGPVGSLITVEGRGFTPAAEIQAGDVVIDATPVYVDNAPVTVKSTGKFSLKIFIPSVAKDEYEITVSETLGLGRSAQADFEVDGEAELDVDPEYGPIGSYVTVEGWNFSAKSGEEVTVELAGLGTKEFETDSNGHFSGTFRIPGAAGTPDLQAFQTDYGIMADTPFRVGLITVILTPSEGPAGTRISVSGGGFDDTDTWNVTFDGEEFIESQAVGLNGVISDDGWAPSLDPGVYEVVVWEETSEISVTTDFTITEPTSLETDPMVAPNEYNVTIIGTNFAEVPDDPTLEFILYNSTEEWVLDVTYKGITVELEADPDWEDDYGPGYFEGYFKVGDDEEISLGTYTLNCTDGQGMFAQWEFSVVEKTQQISPRKPVFAIGETASFNIELSFAEKDSYIKIFDPDDELFWQTDAFVEDVWIKVGVIQRVPYYEQTAGGNPMLLLSDAPLGEYTWEYYDADDDLLDDGVFTVESAPEDVLAERIEDLNNDLVELSEDVSGVSSELTNVRSDINSAIQAANAAVDAANAATDAVNAVAQTANSASQAAQDAATAATEAKQAAQGLTTLVYGAIGAALVAALAAIVSLMQISQKIAG